MSATGNTNTPETDAEAFTDEIGDWGKGDFVPASLARKLETSRDELAGLLREAVGYMRHAKDCATVEGTGDKCTCGLPEVHAEIQAALAGRGE